MEIEINGGQSKCEKTVNRDHLLTCALICDARDGLGSEYLTDPKSIKLYYVYRHWILNYLLYLFTVILHLLVLWEDVGKARSHSKYDQVKLVIELICLTYFASRLVLRAYILPSFRFWHDTKHIIIMITIIVTLIDIIAYICLPPAKAVRWSTCLRPLFIVNSAENRQIRRAIRNIRNTLPDIFNVLILFFLSLATFSIIGFKLFGPSKSISNASNASNPIMTMIMTTSSSSSNSSSELNNPYFSTYFDVFFNLYVLITTANNPDIMIPSYNHNKLSSLFFVTFLIINLYLFTNIILAVIYHNYRKHLKNEVRLLMKTKKDNLLRAFDEFTKGSNDEINWDQFEELISSVFSSSACFNPRANQDRLLIDVYWSLLENNGKIRKAQFLNLSRLMNMKISIIYKNPKAGSILKFICPSFYLSKASILFCKMVKSRYFRYVFDGLIFANAIIIALGFEQNHEHLEYTLLIAFSFEIGAKLYTFGFIKFIKKFWNVFDSLVITSAIILWTFMKLNTFPERNLRDYLNLILVLRVLRICKIVSSIDRFYIIVTTIRSLLPSIMTYGSLLFVVFYFYAIIGMLLFNNLIYPNPKGCSSNLVNCCPSFDKFNTIEYCTINFNSFLNAFLFLFNLMVVNQWHVFAKNIEQLTGHKLTRIYFLSFHLVCVMMVLNIVTAFVIEAFILEFNNATQGSNFKNSLVNKIKQLGIAYGKKEMTIKSDDDRDLVDADHDYIQQSTDECITDDKIKQTRSRGVSVISLPQKPQYNVIIDEDKSVEMLLLRMFQNEIDLDCECASNN